MSLPLAYFTSVGAYSNQDLWVTDGTAAGTHQMVVSGGISGIGASNYAALNGSAYFNGFDSARNVNLFRVDGGTGDVTELLVSNAASSGISPYGTKAWNGKIYFEGKDTASHYTLWSSDGSAAGTTEVVPPAGVSGFYASSLVPFGTTLAFAGAVDTVGGLYLTDGTSAGTRKVPAAAISSFDTVSSIAAINGKLVFGALSSSYKNALFVSDGTGAGTVQLSVPTLNPTGGYNGRVADLVAFGGKAGFSAVDANGTYGIWVTDGTAVGTLELPNLSGASYGVPMAALAGGRLVFIATDGSGTPGVFVSDGTATGTTRLAVAAAATSGLAPHALFTVGNRVYFDGLTSTGTRGLFVSDGTSAGTSLVKTGVSLVSGNIGSDAAALGGTVAYTDTTSHTSGAVRADIYTGPVSYLQQQYIWSSADGVAMAADAPGTFLHGGAGDDALSVTAGSNVLDGGTGSNFLTGAAGTDGGTDTFFVDGRGAGVTWSTINNFHHGDAITLFGFAGGTSTGFNAATSQGAFSLDGAQGYQGATIHSELGGAGTGVNASLTIAGMSVADTASKLTLSTGTVGGTSYLYIAYTGP